MPQPDDLNIKPLQSVTEEIYKKNLELLEQRRRAEQLLYGISEAVFAVDKTLNITLFNHSCERMLGVSAEDVLGKPANEILKFTSEKNELIKAEDFCFSKDTEKSNLEAVVLKGQDKNYYVNIKTSLIAGKGDEECLVTMIDITKEKELEKTKDDFISITSHELRTPMTIIKSYLWMLASEKGGPVNDKQKDYIKKATNGTERMLNLINDMLNISKLEHGKMEMKIEKINVREFVGESLSDFNIKTKEKNLNFDVIVKDDVNEAYADQVKLREVLTNLVGNSLKFTDTGRITVLVEKLNDNFVKVSVTDSGRGIEKNEMDKLFRKFGRLDNSYQTVAESGGTGLGLYIVKQLVESIGGKVGAESEGTGKGSTFWFTIPIQMPQSVKNTVDQTSNVGTTVSNSVI